MDPIVYERFEKYSTLHYILIINQCHAQNLKMIINMYLNTGILVAHTGCLILKGNMYVMCMGTNHNTPLVIQIVLY